VLAVYGLVAKPIMTFRQCAEAYIEAHKGSWSGPRRLHQWQTSLAQYAYAVLADLPVAEIDGNSKGTDLIMRVIEPLWSRKTETASQVRGRLNRRPGFESLCAHQISKWLHAVIWVSH
jgi:hypothetical protein